MGYTDASPAATRPVVDFSPSTSKIRPEGIQAIRALSGNVKLVYILRNPMDRLWSHCNVARMPSAA